MKVLYEAIDDFWKSHPKLGNFFTGGVHLAESPGSASEPYVVVGATELFSPLSWDQDNGGFEDRRTFIVMFFIYTEGVANPTAGILGKDLIFNTFPMKGFDVEGYEMLHFIPQRSSQPETVDKKWSITLEYECMLEED